VSCHLGRSPGQSASRTRHLEPVAVGGAITLAYSLLACRADALLLGEVTMWSSQAGGIEGHHWRLHRTSGTGLPCRMVCECGWTSTAGQHSTVLLELKGHLEESIRNGARLLRGDDQPSAELPTTRST
jgi:hypothetical protein